MMDLFSNSIISIIIYLIFNLQKKKKHTTVQSKYRLKTMGYVPNNIKI